MPFFSHACALSQAIAGRPSFVSWPPCHRSHPSTVDARRIVCCVQERRVAMTAPQAALYDAAVQQFRADAANASGPQPDVGHAFMCMLWMLLTCGESFCSWEDS